MAENKQKSTAKYGRRMTSEPHSNMQCRELGSGHYGRRCAIQHTENINIVKDIFKAVETIPVTNDNGRCVFTIGDYGTADGSVSIPIFREIIGLIRKKHGEIPVQIIYEDQPSNDFNSLLERIHGLIPDPITYLNDFQKVYVMASATSFYHQVIPDDTAHLIMSCMAVCWFSESPTDFQNSLNRYPDATEEEQKVVAAHAAKDWETFLLLRAKELKSGGVLIVSTPAEDLEMKLNGVRTCSQRTMDGWLRIWRQMRDESKITQDEFVNTNLAGCSRYLEECKAPFEDTNSAVYKAGLILISADLILSPCVWRKSWQEKLDKEGVDDRDTWASEFVNQNRCWGKSSFINGLDSTRSESEKEALVGELFNRMKKDMAAQDPRQVTNDSLIVYVYAYKI